MIQRSTVFHMQTSIWATPNRAEPFSSTMFPNFEEGCCCLTSRRPCLTDVCGCHRDARDYRFPRVVRRTCRLPPVVSKSHTYICGVTAAYSTSNHARKSTKRETRRSRGLQKIIAKQCASGAGNGGSRPPEPRAAEKGCRKEFQMP